MQDYEQQLERLKKALNVDSDTAFSQVLGMSQGSVSGAKKRRQIPHAWFFQVAGKTNASLDWLFWGRGQMQCYKNQGVVVTETLGVESLLTNAGMEARVKILEEQLADARMAKDKAMEEALNAYKMALEATRAEAEKTKDFTLSHARNDKGGSKNLA